MTSVTADTSEPAATAADTSQTPVPPELRKGPPRLIVFVAIVLIVGVTMLVVLFLSGGSTSETGSRADGERLEFTIPAGVFGRVAAGEDVDVIPAELHVDVGDTITIHNEDTVGQIVGPYYVPAGQTVQQTFTENATLEGACTAHKDGRIRIVVGTGGEEATAPAA